MRQESPSTCSKYVAFQNLISKRISNPWILHYARAVETTADRARIGPIRSGTTLSSRVAIPNDFGKSEI